jgi:hypothetical protein
VICGYRARFIGKQMKSFLYGLFLAAGMAMLNASAASPSAVFCVLLPNFESSRTNVDLIDDNCVLACARGRSRLQSAGSR